MNVAAQWASLSYDAPARAMSMWISGRCEVGDAELHYLRTGGDHPPLLCLHGLAASGACWTPVARPLAPVFDLVMPDARGHGQSSTPLSGYRYQDHVNDATGLIAELGLVRPVLMGHSMGGLTAAMLGGRLGERLRAVILVDPTFLSAERQRELAQSDAPEAQRTLLTRSAEEVLDDLRTRHPQRSAEMIALLAQARRRACLESFDVLRDTPPDFRGLVRDLTVPALLVFGDQTVADASLATELQQLNGRLQIVRVPGAGHGLPYDEPERLAVIVKSFLDGLPDA